VKVSWRLIVLCGLSLCLTSGCWESPREDATPETSPPPGAALEAVDEAEGALPAAPAPFRELRREVVRRGDTLARMLLRLGVEQAAVPGITRSFDELLDHRRILAGRSYGLLAGGEDGLRWFCYHPDETHRLRIPLADAWLGEESQEDVSEERLDAPDASTAAVRSPRTQDDRSSSRGMESPGLPLPAPELDSLRAESVCRIFSGRIETSLYEAMLDEGASPELVLAFSDICQWDVDFMLDVRAGDSFWLLLKQQAYRGAWLEDELVRNGRILAAEYAGTRDTVRACWFAGGEPAGYFDAEGQSFQKQFLRSPLNYRRISSFYGRRRHPITRRVRLHSGVDFAAPRGTPVVSAAEGTVSEVGRHKGLGKVVRVRHNGRYQTLYGHLEGYARGIVAGARVEQNQVIAYVGSTGLATGPHLHYEFLDRGRSVDPLKIHNQPVSPVPEERMGEFLEIYHERFLERDPGLVDRPDEAALEGPPEGPVS